MVVECSLVAGAVDSQRSATYSTCIRKLLAKDASGTVATTKFQTSFARCVGRYSAVWPKLQKKVKGTGGDV